MNVCYPCRPGSDGGTVGCQAGEVCDLGFTFPTCEPDCRIPGNTCFGTCDLDSGVCVPGICTTDAECKGFPDGGSGGVCAYDRCFGCMGDAGCGSGEVCGSSYTCEPNCLDSGVACPPNTVCGDATGACATGCNSNADCGGATPFCEKDITPHQCAECLVADDCPAGLTGCALDPYCATCPRTCGRCNDPVDCPAPTTCYGTICACTAPSQCASFASTPACVGLGAPSESSFGLCGCASSADCGPGFVCDPTLGETVAGSSGVAFPYVGGGVCLPDCSTQVPAFCAAEYQPGRVCDPATGYCVPCMQDSDCSANASQPLQTPSCIPYPSGIPDPTYYPGFATGGGRCGCSSTAACDDGQTCKDPGDAGECVPPCTFVDGIDSCQPQFGGGYCDTFSGLCVECLDDYDCSSPEPATGIEHVGLCSGGRCVQCIDASQCPGDQPGCTDGVCGHCKTAADCPAGQGFVCERAQDNPGAQDRCLLPCILGDDGGLGTVSDAGPACTAGQPFCVPAYPDAGTSWCSSCRELPSGNDCSFGFCCETYCSGSFSCPN